MLYPWQHDDWQRIVASILNKKLSTLLLHGGAYSGRSALVDEVISYLLCLKPQANHACHACASCTLLQNSTHPDYYLLAPQEVDGKTSQLKIEQIRTMIEFCYKSAHLAPGKVIVLPGADRLSGNVANALLKILEEPPTNCYFILLADNLNRVLPTLKSRALKLGLATPSLAQAQEFLPKSAYAEFWFKYYSGEPLFTPALSDSQLQLLETVLIKPSIENIFSASKELDPKKVGMQVLSQLILNWLSDLTLAVNQLPLYYYPQLASAVSNLLPRLNLAKLYELIPDISLLHSYSEHPLNHKLQLENLLLRYQQLYV
jgi:DNA polymerase-3 subunit delta'